MNQFKVEDTFQIKGRGLIAAGCWEGAEDRFGVGARVRITRPDGTYLTSTVRGVNVFGGCFSEGLSIAVMLADDIAKDEVPRGSVLALEMS
jgi:translation elongation factor EF-Tu-like GTPase